MIRKCRSYHNHPDKCLIEGYGQIRGTYIEKKKKKKKQREDISHQFGPAKEKLNLDT